MNLTPPVGWQGSNPSQWQQVIWTEDAKMTNLISYFSKESVAPYQAAAYCLVISKHIFLFKLTFYRYYIYKIVPPLWCVHCLNQNVWFWADLLFLEGDQLVMCTGNTGTFVWLTKPSQNLLHVSDCICDCCKFWANLPCVVDKKPLFAGISHFCLPQILILYMICGDQKSNCKLDTCGRLHEGFVSCTKRPLFLVVAAMTFLTLVWVCIDNQLRYYILK